MVERNEGATLLRDGRVECWSLLTTTTVREYLALAEKAYKNKGGLQYQREPVKSTTGRRIRSRMVEDIKRGAVLPPLVIGVVVNEDLDEIASASADDIMRRVGADWIDDVAIIDGMQRTTALFDAVAQAADVGNQPVRVECWLSKNTDSLIYRMLVLNTGQVPWNIRRQLQVVYAPLIDEMGRHVRFERLLSIERGERRYKGGEFSPDSLVEAYLAFGLRRTEIDTQEALAEEFSRLDVAEAIASRKYDRFFYPILQVLVDMDRAFSRLDAPQEPKSSDESIGYKFTIGRNIFDSQPARVGFVVACAHFVLGRLGMDRAEGESDAALTRVRTDVTDLVARLAQMSEAELSEYLALDVLSEKLSGQKRSAVGRHERAFFETAFRVLIEERFRVRSLEVCWRA